MPRPARRSAASRSAKTPAKVSAQPARRAPRPRRRTTPESLRELGGTARPAVLAEHATVRFEQLMPALMEFIAGSEVIVGAVAWLSHPDVLDTLSRVPCALVVQKEPYLRPVARDIRYAPTRRRYAALRGGLDRRSFPDPLGSAVDPAHPRIWRLDPVRVVGTAGTGNGNGSPLMHHKFLARCELVDGKLVATAAWAGSANLTRNADRSLEFAIEHCDPVVATAFLGEFARVAAVSEPLAWTSTQPAPQWLGRRPSPLRG